VLATSSPEERQHLHLMPCRHGTMLFPRGDMFIGKSLQLYGEWSEGEVVLFSHLLLPGDQVVEAGANIGTHTLALSRLVGPGGRVWALEPQKLVFQMLCANLGLSEIENVEPLHAAAGAASGGTLIPRVGYGASANFGGVATGGGEDRVPVIPIDALGLAHCKLIKVDVEGHEIEVLKGAAQTIARLRPCLFVEDDRADQHPHLMALLRQLGYRAWWHCAPIFNPENFRGNPVNAFGNVLSINLFCLPEESATDVTLPLPEAPSDGPHIFAH
jgi:FkbM family methyltransferase